MRVTLAVKELMDARGWDVAELARQAEIDPATAESIYAGRSTEMDLATHSKVSEVLGVLPNEILVSVEEPHSSDSERNIAAASYQRDDLPTEQRPDLEREAADEIV